MELNIKTKNTTTNYMGGKAYTLSSEMELYTAVVSTMLDNSYYEKADDRLKRIQTLVKKVPPTFLANLAIYTREKMYLRTISTVLLVELAKVHQGDSLVSKTIERVIKRPDEITELLAYYQTRNERTATKKLHKLSKQIQKGIALAFNKFDAYQLAKYNRKAAITLKDALFLSHPKAKTEDQQLLFDQLVNDELPIPYTWETELSKLGQEYTNDIDKAKAKKTIWNKLIESKKVGYMAQLRNLRSIFTQADQKTLKSCLENLQNPTLVKKSKQLPLRFLSAYAEMQKLENGDQSLSKNDKKQFNEVYKSLEKAIKIACQNIPVNEGKTLILSDNSGSMYGDYGGKSLVSAMSSRTTADIANLFAVMYWSRSKDTSIGLFGDRLITPHLKHNFGLFGNFDIINEAAKKCGGATEQGMFDMFEQLIKQKTIVDRIVIFSDCQVGTGCNWFDQKNRRGNDFNALFKQYKTINPNVIMYSIDLKGYGNTLFSDGVMNVGGWSDKIFDMMTALEQGQSVIDVINSVNETFI